MLGIAVVSIELLSLVILGIGVSVGSLTRATLYWRYLLGRILVSLSSMFFRNDSMESEYEDDLRVKILEAHKRAKSSCHALASRFGSVGNMCGRRGASSISMTSEHAQSEPSMLANF
jgi:hypothetical protein